MRWSVYQVDLEPVEGSEQGGARPALVISREAINAALPIVGVAPLTSRKKGRHIYSTEVVLPKGTAGLPRESIVLGHQVRTVSKRRLGRRYGVLQDEELRKQILLSVRFFLDC